MFSIKFQKFLCTAFIASVGLAALSFAGCDDGKSSSDLDSNTDIDSDSDSVNDADSETGSETATETEADSATDSTSEAAIFSCGSTLTCDVSWQYCEEASGGVDDGSGPDYSCQVLPLVCRNNPTCQCLEDNTVDGVIGCGGDGKTGLTSYIAYP